MSQSDQVQRWMLPAEINRGGQYVYANVERNDNGDYVTYADHARLLAERDARIAVLEWCLRRVVSTPGGAMILARTAHDELVHLNSLLGDIAKRAAESQPKGVSDE